MVQVASRKCELNTTVAREVNAELRRRVVAGYITAIKITLSASQNRSSLRNQVGALHRNRAGCTLSVGREVKMNISVSIMGPGRGRSLEM